MNTQFVVHQTTDELVRACAERFVALSQQSVAARSRFTFSLAGGSTPKVLYALLASEPYVSQIPWQSTFILFGDERAVAPDDDLANFRMARETLFDRVPIAPQNIFRLRGELDDLNQAAKEYGLLIKELGTSLDLCLLGMGGDGHTASLFPHTPGLHETKHRCIATDVASMSPHVRRLTLTFRTLNAARNVWLVVTGEDKAERLHKVLHGPRDIETQPVQGVAPENGEAVWWLDAKAAKLLSNSD